MKAERLNRLRVTGCLPFQRGKAGFALPLFAHPTNPNLRLIQWVDELRGVISQFKLLDDDRLDESEIGVAGPLASIGEDVVYAFVAGDQAPHVGTLTKLRAFLREYIGQHPEQTAIVLQIQELVGASREKKLARANMQGLVLRSAGVNAARAFYEGSTLSAALWQQLERLAPNSTVAKRILAARSSLSAKIDAAGRIVVDLGALSPEDRDLIDVDELTTSLLSEFDVEPTPSSGQHVDVKISNILQSGIVSNLLRTIKNTGRQEERIAILADAILQNRDVGIATLMQYKLDRARIANWAFHELRSRLLVADKNGYSDQKIIADLIPRIFTQQYSLTRGELLFYLAKHLARWPEVNRAIRRVLDRSHSGMIETYRRKIEEILARPVEEP